MRKKLNLTQSKLNEFAKKDLQKIRGGGDLCTCGCCGTSCSRDNGIANSDGGLQSKCPPQQL
jgi:hypothetical protein